MEKRKQKAEYRMFAGTRGDASTALLVFAVFFLFLLGEYHSLRAQEKSAFITQYNERFKAKDYVHAREALDILLASEPKDLQLKREKIKLFGALREETNFLEGMKNLRNQGDMAAVQNFFDIIDCDDVPETFKEKLKAYFQEKKDSFLLANWEKEERKKGGLLPFLHRWLLQLRIQLHREQHLLPIQNNPKARPLQTNQKRRKSPTIFLRKKTPDSQDILTTIQKKETKK